MLLPGHLPQLTSSVGHTRRTQQAAGALCERQSDCWWTSCCCVVVSHCSGHPVRGYLSELYSRRATISLLSASRRKQRHHRHQHEAAGASGRQRAASTWPLLTAENDHGENQQPVFASFKRLYVEYHLCAPARGKSEGASFMYRESARKRRRAVSCPSVIGKKRSHTSAPPERRLPPRSAQWAACAGS